MNLEDELAATVARAKPHRVCSVAWLLERIDPDMAAKFKPYLEHETANLSALSAVIAKHTGERISPEVLNRHRRKVCQCHRTTS